MSVERTKTALAAGKRARKAALKNASTFREIALCAGTIADAIVDDDNILGPLASEGFMAALSSLPHDLRADIADAVSDEAARAQRADRLYLEETAS